MLRNIFNNIAITDNVEIENIDRKFDVLNIISNKNYIHTLTNTELNKDNKDILDYKYESFKRENQKTKEENNQNQQISSLILKPKKDKEKEKDNYKILINKKYKYVSINEQLGLYKNYCEGKVKEGNLKSNLKSNLRKEKESTLLESMSNKRKYFKTEKEKERDKEKDKETTIDKAKFTHPNKSLSEMNMINKHKRVVSSYDENNIMLKIKNSYYSLMKDKEREKDKDYQYDNHVQKPLTNKHSLNISEKLNLKRNNSKAEIQIFFTETSRKDNNQNQKQVFIDNKEGKEGKTSKESKDNKKKFIKSFLVSKKRVRTSYETSKMSIKDSNTLINHNKKERKDKKLNVMKIINDEIKTKKLIDCLSKVNYKEDEGNIRKYNTMFDLFIRPDILRVHRINEKKFTYKNNILLKYKDVKSRFNSSNAISNANCNAYLNTFNGLIMRMEDCCFKEKLCSVERRLMTNYCS